MHNRRKLYWLYTEEAKAKAKATRKRNSRKKRLKLNTLKTKFNKQRLDFIKRNTVEDYVYVKPIPKAQRVKLPLEVIKLPEENGNTFAWSF